MADRERMMKAFNLVCDRDDWRKEIDMTVYVDVHGNVIGTGVIEPITIDEVKEAVAFFTATEATAKKVGKIDEVKVTSVGYRAGPAGP